MKTGPVAYETALGYVLSCPIDLPDRRVKTKINFEATYVLHVACTEQSLDDKISMMWDLDSVGIREPQTVYEAFQDSITQRRMVDIPYGCLLKIMAEFCQTIMI